MDMRKISLFVLGASLLCAGVGLSGCATISHTAENKVNYEFLDSYGDYKLIRKNNDIYTEKFDGSESRQITHTPEKPENGHIVEGGAYIIYSELDSHRESETGYFIVPKNEDDTKRKEISKEEYMHLWLFSK
jgi:hypothetical protein